MFQKQKKRKSIKILVFLPKHMGDALFLTSYLRSTCEQIKKKVGENGSSLELVIFSDNINVTLFSSFQYKEIYLYHPRKFLRKINILLLLVYKKIILHQTFHAYVSYKRIKWIIPILIKLGVLKSFENMPILYIAALHDLMPGNQLKGLGIEYYPWIKISKENKLRALEITKDKATFIIAPLTSAKHKNWRYEYWKEFLKIMDRTYPNYQFLFIGANNDGKELQTFIPMVKKGRLVLGAPIPLVAALINESHLYIGLETGTFNLAVSLLYIGYTTPVVGICSIDESILIPRKHPNITYITPKKSYNLEDAIKYNKKVSMIDSVHPTQVLDRIQKKYKYFPHA